MLRQGRPASPYRPQKKGNLSLRCPSSRSKLSTLRPTPRVLCLHYRADLGGLSTEKVAPRGAGGGCYILRFIPVRR